MVYIFAYGTLKRGRHNHIYLKDAEFVKEVYTSNDYTLIVNGLPFLVEREGEGCRGELYKVDRKTLQELDRLEGHPRFYHRRPITVYDLESHEPIIAQTYIHPDVFKKNLHKQEIVRNY